jgi:hypothetical protein
MSFYGADHMPASSSTLHRSLQLAAPCMGKWSVREKCCVHRTRVGIGCYFCSSLDTRVHSQNDYNSRTEGVLRSSHKVGGSSRVHFHPHLCSWSRIKGPSLGLSTVFFQRRNNVSSYNKSTNSTFSLTFQQCEQSQWGPW